MTNHLDKQIGILATGNALAVLILLAASPIITRLYSPAEFGTLATFAAVASTFGAIAALRLELAIGISKSIHSAQRALKLSLIVGVLFGGILAVPGTYLISALLATEITAGRWSHFSLLWLVITGTILIQTFRWFLIRQGHYRNLAYESLTKSSTEVGAQIVFGLVVGGASSLIGGFAVGIVISVLYLAAASCWHGKPNFLRSRVSPKLLAVFISRYRRFPYFSVPSGLINCLGIYLPIIAMTWLFDAKTAGLFALAQRALMVPVNVLKKAASEISFSEYSSMARLQQNGIIRFTHRIFLRLTLISVIMIGVIWTSGSDLFRTVFGAEWAIAGNFAVPLAIVAGAQLSVSPIAQILNAFEFQQIHLLWDIGRLALVAASFSIAYALNFSPMSTAVLYAVAGSLAYLILLLSIYFAFLRNGRANSPS